MLIFLNLGDRERGNASAYSVFNKGGRGILGSSTSFDDELRGGISNADEDVGIPEGLPTAGQAFSGDGHKLSGDGEPRRRKPFQWGELPLVPNVDRKLPVTTVQV